MASRFEVEVTISSAKDLKNVNWRHGPLKPYAVVWVDPNSKCSTFVDEEGDTSPNWNQTLTISFNDPIEDSTLHVDIVHPNAASDTKPLIGSAKLRLRDVVDESGLGSEPSNRKLELKRPSGRPQGKLEIKVSVRESRYRSTEPNYPPPYAVPPPASKAPPPYAAPIPPYGVPYAAPYGAPPPYGVPNYGAPPPHGGPYAAPPPYGGPYGGQAPSPYYSGGAPYGQPGGYAQGGGYGEYQKDEGKKSKSGMGMGTGLAVGAAAGLLGGLALAEGADYVEDKIADDVAEKVEEDAAYDDDDGDY